MDNRTILSEALTEKAGRKVQLSDSVRSRRKRWLNLAKTNAEQSLGSHLASRNNLRQRYQFLQDALSLEEMPMQWNVLMLAIVLAKQR